MLLLLRLPRERLPLRINVHSLFGLDLPLDQLSLPTVASVVLIKTAVLGLHVFRLDRSGNVFGRIHNQLMETINLRVEQVTQLTFQSMEKIMSFGQEL